MLATASRSGSPEATAALERAVECPPAVSWIWHSYCDLNRGRTPGFGGASLTWQDLEAWMRLRDIALTQWEIDVIFELETVQPKEFDPDD